jgi:hypothetical protein
MEELEMNLDTTLGGDESSFAILLEDTNTILLEDGKTLLLEV